MAKYSCTVEFDGDEKYVVEKINAISEVVNVYEIESLDYEELIEDDDDDDE
jgi:hypothetical protein